jgi:fucose permease
MKNKISLRLVTPVLMSFFVMSFCDMVGIGVDRVKLEFGLSNTQAQLIPMAVFLWFLVLSVPVGILQDKISKKYTLIIGIVITAFGLLLPFLFYSFEMVLIGFAFLGIGNTIVQVSGNPLLVEVVPANRRSSFLSLSQFIKAVGSMLAAPLAGWFASYYGDWKIIFIVFGVVSILTGGWLAFSKVEESQNTEKRATFYSSFKLLGNRYITVMVLGIFLIVGIDVGINAISGQFLLSKFNSAQTLAESGRSLYFFGKMLGTFSGALLLTKMSSSKFFTWSSVLCLIVGLGVANIFPLIFSLTVGRYPDRKNEISGLMVMAISGGAIMPFLMGWVSDLFGVTASILVLSVAGLIILIASLGIKNIKTDS